MGNKHGKSSFSEGFRERFRALLQGKTQKEFARELGVSQPQLARYLAGRIPDPHILIRIANVTQRSIDWLLLGQGAEEALIKAARQLKDLRTDETNWHQRRSKASGGISDIDQSIMMMEAAEIAAAAPAVYKRHSKTILTMIQHMEALSDEERDSVGHFLEALRSGDEEVVKHLINQMRVVVRALKTPGKKTIPR